MRTVDEEMAFALAGAPSLKTALAKRMATAENRGGHDDITAVLARSRDAASGG